MRLTDEQLIARAEKAGWVWLQDDPKAWPGTARYPATGWRADKSFFMSCSADNKAERLRESKNGPGFEHSHDCIECGKPIWLNWLELCRDELIARNECFSCNHWLSLIRDGKGIVIQQDVHRSHYQVGNAKKPGQFNGFGGQKFTILFKDGIIFETCDLWH